MTDAVWKYSDQASWFYMHQKQLTQSLIVKTQFLEHSCSTFTVHGCLMAFKASKCLIKKMLSNWFSWFLATLLWEGFAHAESNHCSDRCGLVSEAESLRFANIQEKTPHQGSCSLFLASVGGAFPGMLDAWCLTRQKVVVVKKSCCNFCTLWITADLLKQLVKDHFQHNSRCRPKSYSHPFSIILGKMFNWHFPVFPKTFKRQSFISALQSMIKVWCE